MLSLYSKTKKITLKFNISPPVSIRGIPSPLSSFSWCNKILCLKKDNTNAHRLIIMKYNSDNVQELCCCSEFFLSIKHISCFECILHKIAWSGSQVFQNYILNSGTEQFAQYVKCIFSVLICQLGYNLLQPSVIMVPFNIKLVWRNCRCVCVCRSWRPQSEDGQHQQTQNKASVLGWVISPAIRWPLTLTSDFELCPQGSLSEGQCNSANGTMWTSAFVHRIFYISRVELLKNASLWSSCLAVLDSAVICMTCSTKACFTLYWST